MAEKQSPLVGARAVKVNALRELQSHRGMISVGGEELRPLFGRTLMPKILDKAFREKSFQKQNEIRL